MSSIQHQQLILRVPDNLATIIRDVLNTENGEMSINVKPIEGHPNSKYEFTIQDKTYPALLQNLPCLLETHKTVDMKIFYKAGDIGQILCVYSDEKAFSMAIQEQKKLDDIDYIPHGITPPTYNIIKKKYSKTREKNTYPIDRIYTVMDAIKTFEMKPVHREIIEEVVDFEEWMVDKNQDGLKLKLDGDKWLNSHGGILLDHPDILKYSFWEEDKKEKEKERSSKQKVVEVSGTVVNTVNTVSTSLVSDTVNTAVVNASVNSISVEDLMDLDDDDDEEEEDKDKDDMRKKDDDEKPVQLAVSPKKGSDEDSDDENWLGDFEGK